MEGLIAIWMLPVWTIGVPLVWAIVDLVTMSHGGAGALASSHSSRVLSPDRPLSGQPLRQPVGAY